LKKEYIFEQTTFEQEEKQEIGQQEHRIIQDQRNIKKLSYELNLLKKM
jgi:hypothetical protein